MELILVDVEPDWCIVYVDEEYFDEGHQYDDIRLIRNAINKYNITSMRTEYYNPEEWTGAPETVDELERLIYS